MKPKRLNAIAPLLLCLLVPSTAMSAPAVKEAEVLGGADAPTVILTQLCALEVPLPTFFD